MKAAAGNHRPHRQGLLRARFGDHRSRPRSATRTAREPIRPRCVAQVKTPQGNDRHGDPGPGGGIGGSATRAASSPSRPGTYEIIVEGRLGEAVLKAEPTTAEVGRPNLEFDRLDLDDAHALADRRGRPAGAIFISARPTS